jgi:NAD(P)-dependent dehydrogenase (short-subunit alcohol dehydrogenase family)
VNWSLEGKVAIVTGGAGGIGRAYARALADAGASVALADLDEAGAASAAAELVSDGFDARGVHVDITSEESAGAMATAVTDAFGGIDILVNNAAIMAEMPLVGLMEYPLDWWDRIQEVNVKGALICTRACAPSMIERGGGKIVNQSSGGAWMSGTPYGISKLAVVALTFGLARELAPHGINVNAIAPGAIETDAALGMFPQDSEWRNRMRAIVPIKGSAPAEDLCGALIYLTSSASDFVTGQCLNVDGGWVMRV